ncbi:hypothetical protein PF004_g7640 [Phytophthora fragariae]|uniref:Uncharacterized protein n=1 Tax=Phytophthora fragariae TaxID=53985 RepID=A0A6G0P937_9STRA|nr:hypothetical protein PF004_g7640 [Phytophthora fragariae]
MVGFAYGKAEGPVTRGGNAKVKLVHSGRWVEEEAESVELAFDELSPRSVSAEEALDGAGTFVGGVICTSRVGAGGTRVWEYGLVVGYRWEKNLKQGWLDVNVRGSVVSVVYSASCTQDIAVEVSSQSSKRGGRCLEAFVPPLGRTSACAYAENEASRLTCR